MFANTVRVSSIDDFLDDGNQPFQLTASVLFTEDPQYSTLDGVVFNFVSEDDPNDAMSLSAVDLTVFYSDDSNRFTTEAGGELTLFVSLASKPTVRVCLHLARKRSADPSVAGFSRA